MISLRLLAGLSIHSPEGPVLGRVSQRRRLALLAVLAIEGRPVSRDKLLGLFWPEMDTEPSRHLLADSLYVLRSGLGEDVITTIGDDVSLNTTRVESDVALFLDAIEKGEPERAVGLYAGPFLDGVFIADAPEFERWQATVRSRLADEYQRALERLATEAGDRGDHVKAAAWWRQLATIDLLSSRVALGLMRELAKSGDRGAALQFARVHEEVVRSEVGSPPDPAIGAFVAELRAMPAHRADKVNVELTAVTSEPTALVPEANAPPAITRSSSRSPLFIAGAVSAAAVALIAALLLFRGRTPNELSEESSRTTVAFSQSIAVLPFDPISSDREAEYIAEGITDALTVALDRLGKLRVVSTTSAGVAKRKGLSATAIGDTLRARYLVEGSVRLVGSQMRIAARLSDARDGKLLWSEELLREFSAAQIIEAEETIARAIATALNLRLSEGWPPSFVGRPPTSTDAYDSYLRGRHLWNSRNPEAVRRSIAYFEEAIAADSTFAAAFSGLSDSYATIAIGNIGDFRAEEYFPRARLAAQRALALDSTLAAAHASLGYVDLLYDLEWEAARRELSRALALSPSNATARIYQAVLFEWTGHFDEALRETQRAVEFDPLSPATNTELGRALFFVRRYDDAATQLWRTMELDSSSFRAPLYLGQVYVQQRRFDDAIHQLSIAVQRSRNSSRPLALLAYAYATAGRRSEALRVLDSIQQRAHRSYVPAFDFAIVNAGLGDVTGAFEWIDRAFADHSIRPYLMDPTFDVLRSDQRYRALLTRLRLPWPTERL